MRPDQPHLDRRHRSRGRRVMAPYAMSNGRPRSPSDQIEKSRGGDPVAPRALHPRGRAPSYALNRNKESVTLDSKPNAPGRSSCSGRSVGTFNHVRSVR